MLAAIGSGPLEPGVVEAVLDPLIDGVSGPLALVAHERWSAPEFVRTLAEAGSRLDETNPQAFE